MAAARKLGGSGEVDALIADGGGAPAGAAAIAAFTTEVTPGDAGASSTSRPRTEPVTSFNTSGGDTPPPAEPPPTRTANASPGSWSTSVADEAQPANSSSGGNRLTRWFGSLSDSSSDPRRRRRRSGACAGTSGSTAQAAPRHRPLLPARAGRPPPRRKRRPRPAAAKARAAGRACSAAAPKPTRTAQPAVAAAPSAGGGYRLQLATSRSEAEAQALWKKVSHSQGLDGVSRRSSGSISAISALSTACASDPSRTRRKALRSATP